MPLAERARQGERSEEENSRFYRAYRHQPLPAGGRLSPSLRPPTRREHADLSLRKTGKPRQARGFGPPECGTSPARPPGVGAGAKPWRGPGGRKSPRDNEGAAAAQGQRRRPDRDRAGPPAAPGAGGGPRADGGGRASPARERRPRAGPAPQRRGRRPPLLPAAGLWPPTALGLQPELQRGLTPRGLWAVALTPPRARPGRMAGKPQPHVCVCCFVSFFFFFFLCVGFFLELFHRNSCNKDLVFSWCSHVAGGVGWISLFSPLPG